MHVLIAEDDAIWRALEISMVEAAGYGHKPATNWQKVFSLLREHEFSGMIVDLSLASTSESGIEALCLIGKLIPNPPDTLVICTHFSTKMLADCYKLRFVKCVISKPKISEHLDEIEKFFGGKIARNHLESLVSAKLKWEYPIAKTDNLITKESRKAVFVVHGRNLQAQKEVFTFLRALDLKPMDWSKAIQITGIGAPYPGEVLEKAFQHAGAIVVILTGDDEARLLRKYWADNDEPFERKLTRQPRPNVLFEAGMAFGKDSKRTILVQFGQIRPFSDIAGRHILYFNGSPTARNEFATRLHTAGCDVERGGKDWLTAGDFDKID